MPPISLPVLHERTSLDHSIGSTLDRCDRLGYYNYVVNRAGRKENYPINFGVAYHEFRENLENLYSSMVLTDGAELEEVKEILFEAALAIALKDFKDPPLEHKKSYLDTGRLTTTCREVFLHSWLAEKENPRFTVISTETAFELPLPSGRMYSGKLDQAIEWNGRLWLRDFKTTSRKPGGGKWAQLFNPNHQFSGYVWAFKQLSGRRVDGVIADVVYNIKSKGPEFHPTMLSRSTGDIEMWMVWAERMWDDWERNLKEDKWPMKTSACGDWGGCFFRECCNSGSWSAIEQWLKQKTIYSYWDPMSPEREVGLPV